MKVPVIANATARPYRDEAIGEILAQQIASSVQWVESVRVAIDMGEMEFAEMGSLILSKMVKEIQKSQAPINKASKGAEGRP